MLDFSVSEIGLIGVVALIAIGPERLPKVARTAGILLGRFRRYAVSVKAEIDREIQQSELSELHKKMNEAAREAKRSVTSSTQEAEKILNSPVELPTSDAATGDVASASNPPVIPADFQQAEVALSPSLPPFGGDPFSVRFATPPRSKPMVTNPVTTISENRAGPEAS